eukprot:1186672-Prorocentrum_minimum.AAC.2
MASLPSCFTFLSCFASGGVRGAPGEPPQRPHAAALLHHRHPVAPPAGRQRAHLPLAHRAGRAAAAQDGARQAAAPAPRAYERHRRGGTQITNTFNVAGPNVGEQREKVGNWTQGETMGRVSGVLSAPLPLLAQEDP